MDYKRERCEDGLSPHKEKTVVCPSPNLVHFSKEKLQIAKSPFLGLRKLFQQSSREEKDEDDVLVTGEDRRVSSCSFVNVAYQNEVSSDLAQIETLRKQIQELAVLKQADPKESQLIEERHACIEKLIAANPSMSLSRAWTSLLHDYRSPLTMDGENQPILDHGKPSQARLDDSSANHRNVYVGMHLASNHKHHKHKHGKHKTHRKSGKKASKHEQEEEELILPPNQQVQFILGSEQQDGTMENGFCDSSTPCVFTEMEELKVEDDGETIWKETARWIKFEECVEEGGDRWSKPHVASLSLHSLFELRSCIVNGVVQLDMVANEITDIADLVLDQMVQSGHLPHDDDIRERVRVALLSGHEHQGEKKKGVSGPIKSVSNFVSRNSDSHLKKNSLAPSSTAPGSIARNKSMSTVPSSGGFEHHNSFAETEKKSKVPYFMKKIPPGAEASNVLIGEVDFLEQRIIAFVRLQDSVLLDRLTEVPIPTRFMFILLGPVGKHRQYHEIGRSIATLMTDEVFHEVAYKAKTRTDLLAGIDEFLDQVTVLPPGAWDASVRIEPPKDLPGNQKKRLEPAHNPKANADHDAPDHGTVGPELLRTGKIFGGLIGDIKRKAKWYKSDFTDCLSIQCLASFIFLYFAVLTPIVTFGGLLGDATHNYIGTMESIFGGAISGCAFHLLSGQPLTIIGSTGPILVFEKIMFEICTSVGIDYISFRFWVGVWTGSICILLVATDASSLVSYITRYTEESFSALISFIFIYEAFKKLIHEGEKVKIWYGWNPDDITIYGCDCTPPNLTSYNITTNTTLDEMAQASREAQTHSHEKIWDGMLYRTGVDSYVCAYDGVSYNISSVDSVAWENLTKTDCLSYSCGSMVGESCEYTPDALFMSVILFFGTFSISMFLKGLKTSRYFPTKVRSVISDFAVTIAIGLNVLFDILMRTNTSKLVVPQTFRPTRDDRTWFIDPFSKNEWWTIPLAIAPALLATILIFMDQQITAVIVNRKENKLKKGCGYHLDLLVVSVMLIICSIMGLPWFVAATVLSITHVNSLKMETETSAPGEAPKFLGVREQRVTGLMIFLMIGLSVFLTPVLAYIPMPVLYGVFLYMGVSSLRGVQFFDRLKLFLMPPKHQPDFIYLRHVRLPKVYLFTAFQALGLTILWVIKSTSPVSIVFPMMVAALVGVRKLFDFGIFTQTELKWLDDIMPESTKKKKEDAKKKKEEDANRNVEIAMAGTGTVNVPLQDGKVLKIPVSEIKYNPEDPSSINISKEMAHTAIWKTLAANEIGNGPEMRKRSGRSKSSSNGAPSRDSRKDDPPPPTFEITDETGV
uniref:Anion exchange protein n=1 Tax=Phallusia mammillata TaxID=59560 RepID=A0A6F9DTU3_9ASCI|nr:electroneutral sodium bicarbonate exchanger 1 [Phallusia mammillata]